MRVLLDNRIVEGMTQTGLTVKELTQAGLTVKESTQTGLTVKESTQTGLTVKELTQAGLTIHPSYNLSTHLATNSSILQQIHLQQTHPSATDPSILQHIHPPSVSWTYQIKRETMWTYYILSLFLVYFSSPGSLQLFFPGCEPEVIHAAVNRCYNNSGIPLEEITTNITNNLVITTNAEFYQRQCANKQNFHQTLGCIRAEYDRCSMADLMASGDPVMSVCDDPKFNFTCVAQVDHHYPELRFCITRQIDQIINVTSDWQDVYCTSMKIATRCQVDMVRRCDPYTADQLIQLVTLGIPPICHVQDAIIG
ncbi:hypothetical protein Btru_054862 [Bulinus truncatus]|nr:hypothetical protein Btru_054862 [Bulinus truncatus]